MNILWRNISLPAFLTNLPKDVDAYPGLGPGQMFVHTQATHTHLNLSLQMCYPSNRDLVFRTLSVCLFPFNVTSLCRLLPALTCFLRSVLRSSAFLRLTASWLISKWHLNTVFKKKMFVNHVTSFSQPDMECLLYYSVFNKKKMTSYNKQRPPREATRGDGVLSKDEQGVYGAQHSSFKCRHFQRCHGVHCLKAVRTSGLWPHHWTFKSHCYTQNAVACSFTPWHYVSTNQCGILTPPVASRSLTVEQSMKLCLISVHVHLNCHNRLVVTLPAGQEWEEKPVASKSTGANNLLSGLQWSGVGCPWESGQSRGRSVS